MQIILDIDGRKAIPIRAIPQVTNWNESPDSVVHTLAAPKITRKYGFKIPSRQNNLFAHQMDAQGHFDKVLPEQWESWVVTLDSLTKKLQANERENADGENWAPWRIKAVLELPDNVFVWLDEFQAWYSCTRPIRSDLMPAPSGDDYGDEDEDESDSLCLAPIFPPEIENRVWRYADGFIASKPDGVQERVVIHFHQAISQARAAELGSDDLPPAAVKVETAPVQSPSNDDWRAQARVIADECFDHDTDANPPVRDSLATKNSAGHITGGYCFRVMEIMQKRGIKGPRGIITNPATVMREALQSKKWWANKQK